MKNLFKFAFVAFALTAFTACGDQGAATEGTDTIIEDTTPADADMDMDATMPVDTTMMMDSTTIVE